MTPSSSTLKEFPQRAQALALCPPPGPRTGRLPALCHRWLAAISPILSLRDLAFNAEPRATAIGDVHDPGSWSNVTPHDRKVAGIIQPLRLLACRWVDRESGWSGSITVDDVDRRDPAGGHPRLTRRCVRPATKELLQSKPVSPLAARVCGCWAVGGNHRHRR